MVIPSPSRLSPQRGALMAELLVAIALLVVAVLPIAYSIASERAVAQAYYERAVAMEIVDGEMEVLLAGGWRDFAPGTHDYSIHANASQNLSEGKFTLTLQTNSVRLVWQPGKKHHGGPVMREATLK
jgi:hypothetical protein